jgi:hypothetical protein
VSFRGARQTGDLDPRRWAEYFEAVVLGDGRHHLDAGVRRGWEFAPWGWLVDFPEELFEAGR